MFGWLASHWFELSFGFFCGSICSLVREFWLSFLFSAGLVLMMYWMMVSLAAHAGARWDNETVAAGMLGCLLGCFFCPALDLLYREPKRARDKQP
jgi:hypothetical protein